MGDIVEIGAAIGAVGALIVWLVFRSMHPHGFNTEHHIQNTYIVDDEARVKSEELIRYNLEMLDRLHREEQSKYNE